MLERNRKTNANNCPVCWKISVKKAFLVQFSMLENQIQNFKIIFIEESRNFCKTLIFLHKNRTISLRNIASLKWRPIDATEKNSIITQCKLKEAVKCYVTNVYKVYRVDIDFEQSMSKYLSQGERHSLIYHRPNRDIPIRTLLITTRDRSIKISRVTFKGTELPQLMMSLLKPENCHHYTQVGLLLN